MDDQLHDALRAFINYREIKKELQAEHQHNSPELEQAHRQFLKFVPDNVDADVLLGEWEKQFKHAELAFHHQGG